MSFIGFVIYTIEFSNIRLGKPFAVSTNEQKADQRKSNINGDVNNYFVQTSNKNKEEDKEVFQKSSKLDRDENSLENNDEQAIESEKIDIKLNVQNNKPPVAPSKSKQKPDIPLHKSKSKATRESVAIKKIMAPPRSSILRNSVISTPNLLDLADENFG